MKNYFAAISLVFSFSVMGDVVTETHFDSTTEAKCDKEVRTLGCGTPSERNVETFMKCIDKKVSSLTPDCQIVHREMKSQLLHSH